MSKNLLDSQTELYVSQFLNDTTEDSQAHAPNSTSTNMVSCILSESNLFVFLFIVHHV